MTGGNNIFKRFLPKNVYDKLRNLMLFRPEDPNDLHQILAAGKKSVLSNAGEKAAFRFPSPGSITGARVPHLESSDHVYDTKFFTHDPANLPSKESIEFATSKTPAFIIAPGHEEPENKAAPLVYDATGLRTTKTATWAALEKELAINKVDADHLVRPEWADDIDKIQEDREKKGLPFAIGRRQKLRMTSNYNQTKW